MPIEGCKTVSATPSKAWQRYKIIFDSVFDSLGQKLLFFE